MSTSRTALTALAVTVLAAASLVVSACGGAAETTTARTGATTAASRPVMVATTPLLGAIVRDAVGDGAEVRVVMPNGSDPHEWRPSAKDVTALQSADLVVQNGLGLEQGLEEAVKQARAEGVPVFTATDHIAVRTVAEGDDEHAHDHGDEPGHGDEAGAGDPHFWTDPAQVRKVVAALPGAVRRATGADVSAPAKAAAAQIAALDAAIAADFAALPAKARNLVTGHESLGYLADRYDLGLVGAVTPSLSSQGQVSAAHLKELEDAMEKAGVRVVFTETGLPNAVAEAIVSETGATLVELGTEALPGDGAYATYVTELARRISSALANTGG
jgi:zinc/manganese transport system substrate-binding protein